MDISPIVTRLKSQLSGFKIIGGAADLEAIDSSPSPISTPAAYVIPLEETATDSSLLGTDSYRMDVFMRFGVVLVVSNLKDAVGAAALDALTPKREAVQAALLKFIVAQNANEIRFLSGSLLQFNQQKLCWLDSFGFDFFVEY